jgi:DNA-binding response OmpR family regulator
LVAAKILLMDSNVRLLGTMSERLNHLGYEVTTATRIHDAVLKGIVVSPDLVVCDVMMPELSGWDIKRLVAQIPSLSETPVLFLSAHHALPLEFYDPSAGLVDALKKSVSLDALTSTVPFLLARQAARQRLMAHPLRGPLPVIDASLLDLCQVLARRAAHGVLRLTGPTGKAELTWSNGALIDATTDTLQGNEAVYAALALPPAELSATMDPPPAVPAQRRVTRPLPDLLAEASRRNRSNGDAERSQPDAQPPVETEEDFLARLAATGVIRRSPASTR